MHFMKLIRTYLVPGLLVSSTLLLAFWLVMAKRSSQWVKGYDLTPKELVGFKPVIPGWSTRMMSMDLENSTDPNILALELSRDASSSEPAACFVIRLVHGYNMTMCMKIKHYTVEKIQDHGVRTVSDPKLQSAFRVVGGGEGFRGQGSGGVGEGSGFRGQGSGNRSQATDLGQLSTSESIQQLSNSTSSLPFQLWRLTSSGGVVSLWMTTMIRSGDFATTEEDICSMAFPRVETPDDPNWVPRGLALEDLKHPAASFNRWWHSRWDGARWDVLTFLRLRPPVYGSEELLSYVTRSAVPEVTPENEAEVTRDLLKTHTAMLKELQKWREGRRLHH